MTQIRLRGFNAEDVDVIQRLWDDPETALLISNRISLASQAAIKSHFADSTSSANRLIIADQSNQAIGYASYQNLCSVSRTYRIGLSLLPAARGRGLGAIGLELLESFLSSQWMAHKLLAEVLGANEASKKLFINSSYRHVGTLESHFLVGGIYYDIFIYEKIIQ
jgi:RimJ/RimL family protein N-acetyltransferase